MRTIFLTAAVLLCSLAVSAQNSISITEGEKMEYDPMIFGHFIEHHHRQIYGGLFDPGNPLSDSDGYRKDVIDALKEIKVPIVRWPGGCFVSAYHWYYGVGKDRQPVFDKAWAVEDPNTFGTDEYVKWCRKVGCEPYICTNAGTGTMEEMSDWVEYCNLSVGKWGRMRIANGNPEPYNVKYWSVGNENYGGWELGAKTVQEWGPLVRESCKLMRSVTNHLVLFAAANFDPNWTMPLLNTAGHLLDYISVHGYYASGWDPYITCMMRTGKPEEDLCKAISMLEKAGYGNGKIKIAFDEWNLRGWYHPTLGDFKNGFDIQARDSNDISRTYTMADALFAGCTLNTCLRHCDVVKIACFSPIVNTRGAVCTSKDGILRRTTYYAFHMYTNRLEKYVVPVSVQSSDLVDGNSSTPIIDAVLTSDAEGKHFVYAVVNKDPDKDVAVELCGLKLPKTVKAVTLKGRSANDYNDFGDEHIKPENISLTVKEGKVSVPAHSITFIEINE